MTEIGHGGGLRKPCIHAVVQSRVSRVIFAVGPCSVVTRPVRDRPHRLSPGIAITSSHAKPRSVPKKRADTGIDGRMIETIRIFQAVRKRALSAAVRRTDLIVDPLSRTTE